MTEHQWEMSPVVLDIAPFGIRSAVCKNCGAVQQTDFTTGEWKAEGIGPCLAEEDASTRKDEGTDEHKASGLASSPSATSQPPEGKPE